MKKVLIFAAATVIGIGGGLYFALDEGESPTVIQRDFTALEELRAGDIMKLQFGADRGSDVVFTHEDGSNLTLAAFEGSYVVLNFWATWCAPCRKEIPHLSELQNEFRGEGVIGLPVTLIINPQGQEIARLIGDANWASDSAKSILTALMAE